MYILHTSRVYIYSIMSKKANLTANKRLAVAALIDAGKTPAQIEKETGLSRTSIWRIRKDSDPVNEQDFEAVKNRLRGRFLLATDILLESALKDAASETPYRRMIMAGIAHDHYLRALMFDRGQASQGVLAQILILVDSRKKGNTPQFGTIDVTPESISGKT